MKNLDPKSLAGEVKRVLFDQDLLLLWRENLKKAQMKYNWEKESLKLKTIFGNL